MQQKRRERKRERGERREDVLVRNFLGWGRCAAPTAPWAGEEATAPAAKSFLSSFLPRGPDRFPIRPRTRLNATKSALARSTRPTPPPPHHAHVRPECRMGPRPNHRILATPISNSGALGLSQPACLLTFAERGVPAFLDRPDLN